ncbi:MAG TPA: response regulator, partial [Steroidobacteraceae bacterium]|nr:response regulator [Steroidobacteraceae bacterium]
MAKILVVDDNATNRKLLVTWLSSEGYLTVEAADGSDGLAAVRRDRPNLVISDILMPTMDGYEFIRRLRAEPDIGETRAIFYTANYHEHEARELAVRCGVQRVLVKPSSRVELLAAVEEALARPGSRLPAPPRADQPFDVEHLRLLTDKLSQKAEELRAANARLSALTSLNVQLASERDPRQLLQQVCSGARELLGASYAVTAVEQKMAGAALIHCHSGLDFGQGGPPEVSLTDGLLGKVVGERRGRRLESDGAALDAGLPAGYPPPHSVLAVPVSSLTRTYGWLCLADKVGASGFSAHDEHLLTILGAQVGRVYENGALYLDLQKHAARLVAEMEERERTTAQLRASEERFRQLAENIEDVFFVQNADRSRTLYVSPAYERIWGQSASELQHGPHVWLARIHPDDRERTRLADQAITAALPQPGALQFRIVRPDGVLRWIMTRIFPIQGEGGEVRGVVGVATDWTNRKVAEDDVLKLNRVYAMLSSINALIVRV